MEIGDIFKPFEDRMNELRTICNTHINNLDQQTHGDAIEPIARERALMVERSSLPNPDWLRGGARYAEADKAERRLGEIKVALADLKLTSEARRSAYFEKRHQIIGQFIDEAQRVVLGAADTRDVIFNQLGAAMNKLAEPMVKAQNDLQDSRLRVVNTEMKKMEQRESEIYASTALRPRGV
jgi:hypothetical protein